MPVDFRYDGSEILYLAQGGSVAALGSSGKLRDLVRLEENPALCLWASPVDGKFLTGHRHQGQYQVRLWDADGNPLSTLDGHEGFINYSAFLDAGNRILTSSADGTIRIWSLEGTELLRLGAKSQTKQAVSQLCCLSSQGDMILAASQELCRDQVVTLWDRKGKVVAFFAHEKKVRALCLSPDDRHVLTGDDEGGVSLWKVEGPLVHRFAGDGKAITAVCFSPSGRHFLATSKDQSARLWEARSGKLLMRFEETDSDLRHAEFSPDGQSFLTASPRTVRIWDLQTLRELLEIRCWDNGLRILSHRFARFCPDGVRVLTIHSDGMVKVWPANPEAALAFADRRGASTPDPGRAKTPRGTPPGTLAPLKMAPGRLRGCVRFRPSLPTMTRPARPTKRPLATTPGMPAISRSRPAGSSMPSNRQSRIKLPLSVTTRLPAASWRSRGLLPRAPRARLHGTHPKGSTSTGKKKPTPRRGDALPLVHHHDHLPGRGHDDLLAQQGSTAPLDHVLLRVHLVGSVDGQVDLRIPLEIRERDPQPCGRPDGRLRGGDATDPQTLSANPFGEPFQEEEHGRARAQAHDHAGPDLIGRHPTRRALGFRHLSLPGSMRAGPTAPIPPWPGIVPRHPGPFTGEARPSHPVILPPMKATHGLALLPFLLLLPGQEPQQPATRPASRPTPPQGGFPGLPPKEAREPLTPSAGLLGAWKSAA